MSDQNKSFMFRTYMQYNVEKTIEEGTVDDMKKALSKQRKRVDFLTAEYFEYNFQWLVQMNIYILYAQYLDRNDMADFLTGFKRDIFDSTFLEKYESQAMRCLTSRKSTPEEIAAAQPCDVIRIGNFNRYAAFPARPFDSICWQVLDRFSDRILLLSCSILYSYRYARRKIEWWEHFRLRESLNRGFLTAAFSEEEKALIADTYIDTPSDPRYGDFGGRDTTDKLFILSEEEYKKYSRLIMKPFYNQAWFVRTMYMGCYEHMAIRQPERESSYRGNVYEAGIRPAMMIYTP